MKLSRPTYVHVCLGLLDVQDTPRKESILLPEFPTNSITLEQLLSVVLLPEDEGASGKRSRTSTALDEAQVRAALRGPTPYIQRHPVVPAPGQDSGTHGPVGQLLARLRGGAARDATPPSVTTPSSSSLLLLGGPLSATDFHLDPGQADSISLAVSAPPHPQDPSRRRTRGSAATAAAPAAAAPAPPDAPLALWAFLDPRHVDALNSELQRRDYSKKQLSARLPRGEALSEGQLRDLATVTVQQTQRPLLLLIEQRAGDRVYVPPGWAHSVVNMRPCVKIAWDSVLAERLPRYLCAAQLRRHVESAKDFMDAETVLVTCIQVRSLRLPRGARGVIVVVPRAVAPTAACAPPVLLRRRPCCRARTGPDAADLAAGGGVHFFVR